MKYLTLGLVILSLTKAGRSFGELVCGVGQYADEVMMFDDGRLNEGITTFIERRILSKLLGEKERHLQAIGEPGPLLFITSLCMRILLCFQMDGMILKMQ